MKSVQTRSVEEIAAVLEDTKSRKRGCSLLIGAGASVSAGIPTAAGFVEIIKNEYKHAYARAPTKTYSACMAELLLSQRRDLIARYVDTAMINWAHLGIALLLREGYVDRVLTTNFDLLVVRACAMLSIFPAIYDFAASQLLKKADLPDQAVFYLHGQRTGFVLMNTEEDMQAHSKHLGPVFEDAANGRSWIIVGYSGETDPVFEHLALQSRFDDGLFWIGYGDRDPPPHVRDNLLACEKDAFFTKGYDADSFFIRLTRALKIFPPDLVSRPFTYVRTVLNQITPFVGPGQTDTDDVMHSPNEWIDRAIKAYEEPARKILNHSLSSEDGDHSIILNVAQYLSLQGDYERVIGLRASYDRQPSLELGDLLSKAYVARGNQLLDEAKLGAPNRILRLFEAAKEMYAAALAIKPERHEALHNWANFLLELAKNTKGHEATTYFALADEKYAAALAIKKDQPEILINWGNMLLDRAKASSADRASEWFLDAEKKYNQALVLNPDMPEIHYGLGNLYLDLAKSREPSLAEPMFAAAEERYKSAIALYPNMAEAHYQWGNLCLDRAKRSEGEQAQSGFSIAAEKFRYALLIRPDMYQALTNWGSSLVDHGKTKEGEEAEQLFEQAQKRYGEAIEMKPDFFEAWNNWGNLLLDWRKRKSGEAADRLFAEAEKKYAEAHRLRPDMPEPLDNWGNLLLDHAKSKTDAEADTIFEEAGKKYAAAWQLRPSMFRVLNNWANCLSDQGRRKSGEQAMALFAAAKEKYKESLALGSRNNEVMCNFANLLVDSGEANDVSSALQMIELQLRAGSHGTRP